MAESGGFGDGVTDRLECGQLALDPILAERVSDVPLGDIESQRARRNQLIVSVTCLDDESGVRIANSVPFVARLFRRTLRPAVAAHFSHTACLRVFDDPRVTKVQTPIAGGVRGGQLSEVRMNTLIVRSSGRRDSAPARSVRSSDRTALGRDRKSPSVRRRRSRRWACPA